MRDTDSIFSFVDAAESEGLDINAIFGNTGVSSDINPFDTSQTASGQNASAPAPAPRQASAPDAAPAPAVTQAQALSSEAAGDPASVDLIQSAFQKQDEENTRKGLFEKCPVFSYGGTTEEIKDPAMTFEELRIAKSEDFPELADVKKVSWTVEYGKSVRTINDPKGTTIASVKEALERSKDFLNNLKKAKDKSPTCFVKPKITSQSKGIASYKGIFATVEEARASDKTICLIPSGSGKVFELRKTEMGEFLVPKSKITEFSDVRAGFTPALPLIPRGLMRQIIGFFRHFMDQSRELEALVHIYWDREEETFVAYVPHQQVFRSYLDADLRMDALPEERYLHYTDIHSHNSMEARFSQTDDRDELATRLYIVIGRLDRYFPDITARMSCGGVYWQIDPAEIIEPMDEPFPAWWLERVSTQETRNTRRLDDLAPEQPDMPCSVRDYQEILSGTDETFRYQLLSQLEQDCCYYLDNGSRNPSCLWAKAEERHIALMKALWNSFPEADKPMWLSLHDIERYEEQMLSGGRQV